MNIMNENKMWYFSIQWTILKHKTRLGPQKTLCSLLPYCIIAEKIFLRLTRITQSSIHLWKHFKGLQEHELCDHQEMRKSWEPNGGWEYMQPSAVVPNWMPLLPAITLLLQSVLSQENEKLLSAVIQLSPEGGLNPTRESWLRLHLGSLFSL